MPEPQTVHRDDPTIGNDAQLWRRIPPWRFVFDENLGKWRPSSAAFEDHPDGSPMSVVLAQQVLDESRTAGSILAAYEGFGLACFTAGLARENRQGVMRKPQGEEPAHAEVFGQKTNAVKKALARKCHWVVPPPET